MDNKRLVQYREFTFHLSKENRLSTSPQALKFIDERGFVFFWPIKGIHYPSLWTAVAGDRPVPNNHDDPAHITWRWKDEALGRRIWYYAKVLRHKATFISLGVLPYFYALSSNFGSPGEDYLIDFENGNLTLIEKQIFETIMKNGPMHTIELRRSLSLSEKRHDHLFNRGMGQLQSDFRILPIGIAEAGTWKYSFIYDLTHRHFPQLVEEAHLVSEMDARRKLVELFFLSMGCSKAGDIQRMFQWRIDVIHRVLDDLVKRGTLIPEERSSEKSSIDYWISELKN